MNRLKTYQVKSLLILIGMFLCVCVFGKSAWIFEEDSFVPQAKLVNGKSYSIITDHLGTPTDAYDEKGKKVWSRELDIYGKVRKFTGDKYFCSFGWQGMYFDEETELYNVRHRYYSCDTGAFISQDPISIAGGLNVYAYVHDSNSWIDPFGLSKFNPIEVLGRKVYQNGIDYVTGIPDFVDSSVHPSIANKIKNGATNLDLMKTGNAPIGIDGKQINLHHILGQEPGSMVELSETTHKKYHKQLHGLIEDGRSFRHNKDLKKSYRNFKSNYWKFRAAQIEVDMQTRNKYKIKYH